MDKTFEAELLALSFLEALMLDRDDDARAVVASADLSELRQMLLTISRIAATDLEHHYSLTGAIERIAYWRSIFLNPPTEADVRQWVL